MCSRPRAQCGRTALRPLVAALLRWKRRWRHASLCPVCSSAGGGAAAGAHLHVCAGLDSSRHFELFEVRHVSLLERRVRARACSAFSSPSDMLAQIKALRAAVVGAEHTRSAHRAGSSAGREVMEVQDVSSDVSTYSIADQMTHTR